MGLARFAQQALCLMICVIASSWALAEEQSTNDLHYQMLLEHLTNVPGIEARTTSYQRIGDMALATSEITSVFDSDIQIPVQHIIRTEWLVNIAHQPEKTERFNRFQRKTIIDSTLHTEALKPQAVNLVKALFNNAEPVKLSSKFIGNDSTQHIFNVAAFSDADDELAIAMGGLTASLVFKGNKLISVSAEIARNSLATTEGASVSMDAVSINYNSADSLESTNKLSTLNIRLPGTVALSTSANKLPLSLKFSDLALTYATQTLQDKVDMELLLSSNSVAMPFIPINSADLSVSVDQLPVALLQLPLPLDIWMNEDSDLFDSEVGNNYLAQIIDHEALIPGLNINFAANVHSSSGEAKLSYGIGLAELSSSRSADAWKTYGDMYEALKLHLKMSVTGSLSTFIPKTLINESGVSNFIIQDKSSMRTNITLQGGLMTLNGSKIPMKEIFFNQWHKPLSWLNTQNELSENAIRTR